MKEKNERCAFYAEEDCFAHDLADPLCRRVDGGLRERPFTGLFAAAGAAGFLRLIRQKGVA